jgi:uncharacterized protein (TIGR03437 family)
VLGGSTGSPSRDLWVNSLVLAGPPALRIDAIANSVSRFTDPLSDGETILVQGAGFGTGLHLLVSGVEATPVSVSPTTIVAIVPTGLPGASATVQVLSDGAASNSVTVALVHL